MRLSKLGRYDLIRVLGRGAMGLVYEARDPNLDRRVAIKTILVENLSDEAAAEYEVRFRTEARSAARLQHPNIVSVYDSDRDLDIAYLVMEFIEGDDLKYHLDRGKVYTLAQTLGIMRDLLSALDYAHQQSIVHRDIKPANLLMEASGRVKLTDFGVARIQNSGEATRTQGTMVGTLKYMSPEQIQGHPVDARADLFAAGIVLYQLLTGKRAFDAETDFALIQQIISHEPAAPSQLNPQLPPALDAVMARALAKSRNQRYATAQAFSEALQEASRQAADPTVISPSSLADKRTAASTWTATLRAGESLLGTQPGSGLTTDTATPIHMGTNTSGSIVAQELELVYWKDIKDSTDVEDIEVFLAKFPAGVYADLARRRLKKLVQPPGEASGIGLADSTLLAHPVPEQDDMDKTIMVPRHAAATTAPAESAPQKSLEVAPPTMQVAGIAPRLPEAVPTPIAPADTLSHTLPEPTAIADQADRPTQPTKTPVAPPRLPFVAAAVETNTETSPPNTPPAATLPASTTQQQPEKHLPPAPVDTTHPPRRLVWAIAGVVALACAAVGVKFFSSSPATDASLAITGTASAPVTALVTAPVTAPPAAASIPDLAASALPGVALPTNAMAASSANAAVAAASAASAPASSASAAAASKAALAQAAAKKAAIEKDRLAKLALEKNTAPSSPADNAVAPPPPSSPEKTVTPVAAPAAVATSPRQACEDRVLIGFQICMRDQCAKPAFANHPMCVERKAMEQQRRDAQIGK